MRSVVWWLWGALVYPKTVCQPEKEALTEHRQYMGWWSKACTNLVGVKPWVAGVTAAALEESKGTELEEPKIVTITTPASLTLRWESEKGLKMARSLKPTTTQPAVGGPKTFWEDQRVWRPKNLAAQRAEGTKVLRRQTTGGTKNI